LEQVRNKRRLIDQSLFFQSYSVEGNQKG